MNLNQDELVRYARHLVMPQFGIRAQEKLKNAKVLVIGAGGLGAPILQYLTAAGIGKIGLVEFDEIDLSNLQRQVLYTTKQVGAKKGKSALKHLKELNPTVDFTWFNEFITRDNALKIIENFDLVIDGSDNFPTRYLVNDACIFCAKPLVYGSIHQFEGHVSVFNFKNGPNYRDLFPSPPSAELAPNCAEGGVLGVLPGIIGSMQALEAIKILAEIGETLSGKLFVFNALNFSSHTIRFSKNPDNPLTGSNPSIHSLIDYDLFCSTKKESDTNMVNEIEPKELKEWLDSKRDFVLIDVREEYEFEQANINAELIPQGEIEANLSAIPKDKEVVLMCRTGIRSANAIRFLDIKYGYKNLLNLKGGIVAWAEQIDPSLIVI